MSQVDELREVRERVPDDLALTRRTVVAVYTPRFRRDGTVARPNGSGVLVEAGGRHFVLTAGHVVDDCETGEIAIGFPTSEIVLPAKPGFGIQRVEYRQEPDVAYVELDGAELWRWKHMSPLPIRDVASCPTSSDLVLLCGFPHEMSSDESFVMPPERQNGKPVLEAAGGHGAVSVRTQVANGARHAKEPSEGRGFHVGFSVIQDPQLGGMKRIAPEGLSGGPIFLFARPPALLLGLVRSKHDGLLWCEPVCEVLRLLSAHPSEAVARDAEAALASLTE